MPTEIERKFLVKNDDWRGKTSGKLYHQGYLSIGKNYVVRIRRIGSKGFLTIKSSTVNAIRKEYEYPIPLSDAKELLQNLCSGSLIKKIRYQIEYKGHIWEIDEFLNDNKGLILAEIELSQRNESIELPDWIGEEVTADPKYYNSYLYQYPFSTW